MFENLKDLIRETYSDDDDNLEDLIPVVSEKKEPIIEPKPSLTYTRATAPAKLEISEIMDLNDRQRLGDSLKAKKAIVVSFEYVQHSDAVRVYEFLCGVTYGLNGNVQKISPNVYLFAPATIEVDDTTGKRSMENVQLKNPWGGK